MRIHFFTNYVEIYIATCFILVLGIKLATHYITENLLSNTLV